jgi:hypothetical protein
MLVLLQPEVLAAMPLNVTVPEEPKLLPAMVTVALIGRCLGDRLLM